MIKRVYYPLCCSLNLAHIKEGGAQKMHFLLLAVPRHVRKIRWPIISMKLYFLQL